MKDIILSIKPCFTREIYKGFKKVELRKKVGHHFEVGSLIYIYSSSPVKKITGYAYIQKLEKLTVENIRNQYLTLACISSESFDEYYCGSIKGFVIWLEGVVEYRNGPALEERKQVGFSAPQSFCYVTDDVKAICEVTV